jgi:hypothetical protein
MKWDRAKLAGSGLAALMVYAAIRSIFRAASRPFWFDELCTVAIARQPSISAIWKAEQNAADSHPPTFYFVERLADRLIPNQHIAFRMPSILAFCCLLLCVFVFVRRRSGGVYGLFCSALILMSIFFDPHAVDARGYALMSACLGFALVCYQRADKAGWMMLLGLSLAAAGAFHYYAVCTLFCFALGEVAFTLQNRRLRIGVWAALACGMLPLVAFWPLLAALRTYYGAHFWAQPTWSAMLSVLGWFLKLGTLWGIAITAAAFLGLAASMVAGYFSNDSGPRETDPLFHEKALVLGLLVLPVAIFLAMKLTHGGFIDRYVLPAGLGIPLAAGFILPRFNRNLLALLAIGLCFGLAAQEGMFWMHQFSHLGKVISPATAVERLVNGTGRQDLPVVVSDSLDYLPLAFYASPGFAARLVEVVDPAKEIVYSSTDSVDKQLQVLRLYAPLHVYEFRDFSATHPEFLLYSGAGEWDWWPARLVDDGYTLRLIAIQDTRRVYLVGPKEQASQGAAERVPPAANQTGERR